MKVSRRQWKTQWILVWVLAGWLLSACSDSQIEPGHAVFDAWQSLVSSQTAGQTFVARFNGLEELQVYLALEAPASGQVILHLRTNPGATDDLRTASLPAEAIRQPGFYPFGFEPLGTSNNQAFYAFLEVQTSGRLSVGRSASIRTYTDGAFYVDDQPQQAQMAFRLGYEPSQALLGLGREAIQWLLALLAYFAAFVLPSWALLQAFWPGWAEQEAAEKLIVSAGLGCALFPLWMLWTDAFHWHPGALLVWLPAGMGFFYLLIARGKKIEWPASRSDWVKTARRSLRISAPSFSLVLVVGILFVGRFWAVRTLAAPMWGDSVQHTVMTQLMLDHGGLFQAWDPYTPYQTLSTHFGFSSLAAGLSWAGGMGALQAVLWMGQILNVVAVAGLYPLARYVSKGNRWAGVAAVLAAGAFSNVPAVYVNWGRYAQLAGEAALPASIWLLLAVEDGLSRQNGRTWQYQAHAAGKLALAGAALAGMTLCYYRMPYFYGAFAIAWLALWLGVKLFDGSLKSLKFWGWLGLDLACIAVIGVALLGPWLPKVFSGNLPGLVLIGTNAAAAPGLALQSLAADYQSWLQLSAYIQPWVAALAVVGALAGILQRAWRFGILVIWTAILASIRTLALWHIPGAVMFESFSVIIWLYLPCAAAIGWMIGLAATRLIAWNRRLGIIASTVLLVAAAAWGVWNQRFTSQPEMYSMVTRPDLQAMQWIRANTPADSVFMVQAFRKYNGASASGADAGWWIPLLTGRKNTLPPQYALLNEVPEKEGYTQQVVDLVRVMETDRLNSPAGQKAVCAWGIDYLYMGQGQGQVSFGNPQLFTIAEMELAAFLQNVYHQDGVNIYKVKSGTCSGS